MANLQTCLVNSTNSGKELKADILKKSDKAIRVAIQGTDIVLTMTREDVRRPYVGSRAGLEFTTYG